LFYSRLEAKVLASLVPRTSSLQLLDFKANLKETTNGQLEKYRIIHFAAHAIIDDENPELSGIALSFFNQQGQAQMGVLRMHEIFELKLKSDLVVLSACRSGLGKQVPGEGILSLTRGFMYAKVPRVIVSLWSVDDRATAELMGRFYQKFLGRKGTAAAAALRAAQIEMAATERWHSPYYWAGFVLQGEWK
jgi:CHAT domain-containing protein